MSPFQLRESVKERSASIEQLAKRIGEIEDRLFSAFSLSVGVASIREYEESRVRSVEESAAEKLRLAVKKSRIVNQ